jgi:hypothetical protein
VKTSRLLQAVIILVASALFAASLRMMGLRQIADGLARVGWGLVAVLALSGARDAVRAFAWTRAVEPPPRLRFPSALRARLVGEALNTLLPMGIVLGEATKAFDVGSRASQSAHRRSTARSDRCTSSALLVGRARSWQGRRQQERRPIVWPDAQS